MVKYINNYTLLLFLITLLFTGIGQKVYAASTFNIGVIHDCKTPSGGQILDNIKTEITALTKGEFDVRFPKRYDIVSDCSEAEIKKVIDRLLGDPDVHMILTLDPLGSHSLGHYKRFSKPCIAAHILNPKLQGIPNKGGKSGVSNLTYIVLAPDLADDIKQFRKLVPFNAAAVLLDSTIIQTVKSQKTFLSNTEKETGTELVLGTLSSDLESIKPQKNKTVDAIFLGTAGPLEDDTVSKFISYATEKKVPVFSFFDKALVEKGLLAGFDRQEEIKRYVRRIAILTQRILLKENPKNFKVAFVREKKMVINMKTARAMDISPQFSLLAESELIGSNSLIPFGIQATRENREEILLPSEDIIDPDDLNKETFGLDESSSSLSLVDAVNLALKNNLLLKSREKETEAGKMNVRSALSKFYPQLGAGLNWTAVDEEHTSAISGVAERSWDISARVSQLLFSDALHTNLKTARRLQTVQELSERQKRLDIVLETSLAYLNMLKARANAKIQLENLKLVQANLALANNRYKAGYSSPSDVYRLESESSTAYSNFLFSLAAVKSAMVHLNQILNLDLEENITIKDINLEDGQFLISDPEISTVLQINNSREFEKFRNFIVTKGLEDSPEIKALDEQIMIQQDAYDLAKRSYWSPNVSANGRLGNTFSKSGEGSDFDSSVLPEELAGQLDSPDETYWSVSLNVDIPFYEGGSKSAARVKAVNTKSQLALLKRNIQNLISENIRTSLYKLSASYPSIELRQMSAVSAEKNLQLVQNAYSQGAVSIVNLLDAQNASLIAKTLAENAVYEFFIDVVVSERATGNFSIFMDDNERRAWIEEFQR